MPKSETPTPSPEQIRAARLTLGRTQAAFAKMIGVSLVTYSRWENGHAVPQPDRRERLWKLIRFADNQKKKEG